MRLLSTVKPASRGRDIVRHDQIQILASSLRCAFASRSWLSAANPTFTRPGRRLDLRQDIRSPDQGE